MTGVRPRPVLLLLDLVAVLAFAAIGRESHAEGVDVLGVLAVAAPFAAGAAVGALVGRTWRAPTSWSAGLVTWAGAVVLGLALRAAVEGRLPASFAVVATISLGVLLLGWRGVARLVSAGRDRRGRVRGTPEPVRR